MSNRRQQTGDAVISLRVVTRSKRPGLERLPDGRLQLRVSAPPSDGAANREVCRRLADIARVPVRRVGIIRGEYSQEKDVRFAGITIDELRARLTDALGNTISSDCGA